MGEWIGDFEAGALCNDDCEIWKLEIRSYSYSRNSNPKYVYRRPKTQDVYFHLKLVAIYVLITVLPTSFTIKPERA